MGYSFIRRLSDVEERRDYFTGNTTGKLSKWWYGVEGIYNIFNGAWSDPEIAYGGYAINAYVVEDTLWERYNEEYPEPDYNDRELYKAYEDGFAQYVRDNADEARELIYEIILQYEESTAA